MSVVESGVLLVTGARQPPIQSSCHLSRSLAAFAQVFQLQGISRQASQAALPIVAPPTVLSLTAPI